METRTYNDVGKITRFWLAHLAIIIIGLYSKVYIFCRYCGKITDKAENDLKKIYSSQSEHWFAGISRVEMIW